MNDKEKQASKVAKASVTATQLVADTLAAANKETAQIVSRTIKDYFDEGEERKRFIDVNRIPFICDDIKQIKQTLMNQNKLIYIGIGIVAATEVLLKYVIK